jgi:hypothetical protein
MSTLHYGTDPLLGFHLATAYTPLTKGSPLNSQRAQNASHFKLVDAARQQFRSWIASFRQYLRQNLTMRFSTSEAIAFSYALQQRQITGNNNSAGIFRDPHHLELLILDGEGYMESGDAPISFTLINTLNLIDHVGALNLFVTTAPLLNNTASSSLCTQSLVKSQDTEMAYIDSLLCGHFPTISTLLSLIPVEYWANTSATSMMDDLMMDSSIGAADQKQMHIKLTWKRYFPTQAQLRFDETGLARILYNIYLNMFANEDMKRLFSNMNRHTIKSNSLLCYNRRSYVLFLRFVRTRVICN